MNGMFRRSSPPKSDSSNPAPRSETVLYSVPVSAITPVVCNCHSELMCRCMCMYEADLHETTYIIYMIVTREVDNDLISLMMVLVIADVIR